MKSLCLIVFGVAALAATVSAQQQKYTDKFDNINVDQVLSNDRILNNYLKCLLEKGPCTQEGRELKKTLPDALRTNCEKCSEKQRTNSRKVISHLESKKPAEWKKLLDKYDPEGIYKSKFEKLNKRT
ncbi:ejaculatory bulb-specific protein 3 [Aedes albopictus]|uniref:Protein serine/threonine kinase n=1 Tax=Aedes albopictus TaxID=7160 RepID=A0A023EG45_AEDAL|nr:ejaculatory bulb-specific protein 3 [Aedes albopictus]XP_029726820.1 ejaculatory bulb-specific protein 3 [Aedes albopictus]